MSREWRAYRYRHDLFNGDVIRLECLANGFFISADDLAAEMHRLRIAEDLIVGVFKWSGKPPFIALDTRCGTALKALGLAELDLSDRGLGLPANPLPAAIPETNQEPVEMIKLDTPRMAMYFTSKSELRDYNGFNVIFEETVNAMRSIVGSDVTLCPTNASYALTYDSRIYRPRKSRYLSVRPILHESGFAIGRGAIRVIKAAKTRYTVLFTDLMVEWDGAWHKNLLVFDNARKIVSRFEPHGTGVRFYSPHDTSNMIAELSYRFPDYVYAGPEFISTNLAGPQALAKEACLRAGHGYCFAWCSLFTIILAKYRCNVHQAYNALGTDPSHLESIIEHFAATIVRRFKTRHFMEKCRSEEKELYVKKFGAGSTPVHSSQVDLYFGITNPNELTEVQKEFSEMAAERLEVMLYNAKSEDVEILMPARVKAYFDI